MKTEIPQDRQTGRLAREHSNRGKDGRGRQEIWGTFGHADRGTDRQMSD
jgi:hypothetical protein